MSLRVSQTGSLLASIAVASLLALGACGQSQAVGSPPATSSSTAAAPKAPSSSAAGAASKAGSSNPGSAASKPATAQKANLAYSAVTAFQSLMWISKDKGLFDKYGLNTDVQQVPTQQQIAAVVAGKVDIGITSADNIASAILSGADLKEIGLFVPYIEAAFYTRPEIKTAQQLKGKLVGASTAGPGIIRKADEYALTKLGLDPNKDVEIRVFRTTTDALAAMKAGEIQAMAMVPPDTLESEKAGFNMLYDVSKERVLYPSGSTYTTTKFIKEHPDIVLSYMKAISEGIAVYKSDPDFAMNTYLKWAGIKDRDIAKAGWDWFHVGIPDIPKWSEEPMKATLEVLGAELPKAKTADPTTLYDNSFVDQLEKSGFYADLQKQYPRPAEK